MKSIWRAFTQFLIEIRSDFMLAACLLTPVLMGLLYKFVIPVLEEVLTKKFTMVQVITPYYRLLDLLILVLTSIMFAFAGIMVVLGEIDNGTAKYLIVTPLGKKGYLMSRIGIPMIISVIYGTANALIFKLSDITIIMILICSILSSLMSITISLLVISLSKNKLEGMALTKLSGFFIIGLPAAFLVTSPIGYSIGILPSFWLGKFTITTNWIYIIPYLVISFLWIGPLYRKFLAKLF